MSSGLLVLGAEKKRLIVPLTTGSDQSIDFVIRDPDGWPTGSSLKLIIGSTTITATTVSSDTKNITISAATGDAIADGTPARLVYTDTENTFVLSEGVAKR